MIPSGCLTSHRPSWMIAYEVICSDMTRLHGPMAASLFCPHSHLQVLLADSLALSNLVTVLSPCGHHLEQQPMLSMRSEGHQTCAGGRHVLIKTHGWSDQWQVPTTCSCLITLTHRDLRGVLASYQRMGWAYRINSTYVEEHQRWKVKS